jgi:hypothetical protein
MTAASLALVNWPALPVTVLYDPDHGFGRRARKFLQLWDLDGNFRWTPSPCVGSRTGLCLLAGEKTYSGFRALRMIVLLNPITYVAIAVSIAIAGDLSEWAVLYRRVIVATCLVFLLPPLAWFVDLLFHDVNPEAANMASNLDSGRRAT